MGAFLDLCLKLWHGIIAYPGPIADSVWKEVNLAIVGQHGHVLLAEKSVSKVYKNCVFVFSLYFIAYEILVIDCQYIEWGIWFKFEYFRHERNHEKKEELQLLSITKEDVVSHYKEINLWRKSLEREKLNNHGKIRCH